MKLTKNQVTIKEWLEAGNTGTLTQICAATGIKRPTVYSIVRGIADVVGEIPVTRSDGARGNCFEYIWGQRGEQEPEAAAQRIVESAIESRTPLELAWAA